jgi:MYXO-CTERM domain-containing protein
MNQGRSRARCDRHHERILLAGGVMLDGVMNVSFIDGFVPAESDTFQLIDLGTATVTGWFSSVNAPAGWSLNASGLLYNNSAAVPEPATLLLALFGLALLPRRRRR